jgi:hypothetical protein
MIGREQKMSTEENLSCSSNTHDEDESIYSIKNESGAYFISPLKAKRVMYERKVKEKYNEGIKVIPSFKVANETIKRKPPNKIYFPSKPISKLERKKSGSRERLANDCSRDTFTLPSENTSTEDYGVDKEEALGKVKDVEINEDCRELNDSGEEIETSVAEEFKEPEKKEEHKEIARSSGQIVKYKDEEVVDTEIPIEVIDSNYAQILLSSSTINELKALIMRYFITYI